jgi:hypothetical protein
LTVSGDLKKPSAQVHNSPNQQHLVNRFMQHRRHPATMIFDASSPQSGRQKVTGGQEYAPIKPNRANGR